MSVMRNNYEGARWVNFCTFMGIIAMSVFLGSRIIIRPRLMFPVPPRPQSDKCGRLFLLKLIIFGKRQQNFCTLEVFTSTHRIKLSYCA